MQSVFGVRGVQSRRLAIKLERLEAVPGALHALGRTKQPPGLILGPEAGRKSQ